MYLGFLIETVILGNIGIFGMTNSLLFEMYIVVFLMTVLAFYMHRKNIGRLLKGCESKTYLSKKKKAQAETKTV